MPILLLLAVATAEAAATPPPTVGFASGFNVSYPERCGLLCTLATVEATIPIKSWLATEVRVSASPVWNGYAFIPYPDPIVVIPMTAGPRFGGSTGFYASVRLGAQVPIRFGESSVGWDYPKQARVLYGAAAGWTFKVGNRMRMGPELELGVLYAGLNFHWAWTTRPD